MLFKYQLCDYLKQLIKLFETILPRTDDEMFDVSKQRQRTWKTMSLSKLFLALAKSLSKTFP